MEPPAPLPRSPVLLETPLPTSSHRDGGQGPEPALFVSEAGGSVLGRGIEPPSQREPLPSQPARQGLEGLPPCGLWLVSDLGR